MGKWKLVHILEIMANRRAKGSESFEPMVLVKKRVGYLWSYERWFRGLLVHLRFFRNTICKTLLLLHLWFFFNRLVIGVPCDIPQKCISWYRNSKVEKITVWPNWKWNSANILEIATARGSETGIQDDLWHHSAQGHFSLFSVFVSKYLVTLKLLALGWHR